MASNPTDRRSDNGSEEEVIPPLEPAEPNTNTTRRAPPTAEESAAGAETHSDNSVISDTSRGAAPTPTGEPGEVDAAAQEDAAGYTHEEVETIAAAAVVTARARARQAAATQEHRDGLQRADPWHGPAPVSYTHLRAPETPEHGGWPVVGE